MKFKSLEDVQRFDASLRQAVGDSAPLHVDLAEAWSFCQVRGAGGRLFPAVLDLQFHTIALSREVTVVGRSLNLDLRSSADPDYSSDPEALARRLDLFTGATSFVLRCRAIWDKLMGVLVLLVEPTKYEGFVAAPSRKKKFGQILAGKSPTWAGYAEQARQAIADFDERFRTPEAHGTGRIRKLLFHRATLEESPLEDLLWAWNTLNSQMNGLRQVFALATRPDFAAATRESQP